MLDGESWTLLEQISKQNASHLRTWWYLYLNSTSGPINSGKNITMTKPVENPALRWDLMNKDLWIWTSIVVSFLCVKFNLSSNAGGFDISKHQHIYLPTASKTACDSQSPLKFIICIRAGYVLQINFKMIIISWFTIQGSNWKNAYKTCFSASGHLCGKGEKKGARGLCRNAHSMYSKCPCLIVSS